MKTKFWRIVIRVDHGKDCVREVSLSAAKDGDSAIKLYHMIVAKFDELQCDRPELFLQSLDNIY